jgi:hypothetical protein
MCHSGHVSRAQVTHRSMKWEGWMHARKQQAVAQQFLEGRVVHGLC